MKVDIHDYASKPGGHTHCVTVTTDEHQVIAYVREDGAISVQVDGKMLGELLQEVAGEQALG